MEMKLSSKTTKHDYGSPEFYSELFSDILADVGDDDGKDHTHAILEGLRLAAQSWYDYHQLAAYKYADFLKKIEKITPG